MKNSNQSKMELSKSAWTVYCTMIGFIGNTGYLTSRDENNSDEKTISGIDTLSEAMEILNEAINNSDDVEMLNHKNCAFHICLEDSTYTSHLYKTFFSITGKEILALRKAGLRF